MGPAEISELSAASRPMWRPRRSCWTPFLVLGAVLAILPVTSAHASEHADSNDGAPTSTDSVEVVRGIAPEWPFQGFFAPALGRFWDTDRGRVHDLSNGMDFGACYQLYVEANAESVRMGYASYTDPDKHYVIPWGDIAYPVISRRVTSQRPSDAVIPSQDLFRESYRLTDERITLSPRVVGSDLDGPGEEYEDYNLDQIVAFWAQNSRDRRLYLPLDGRRGPVGGFVEIEPDGLPLEDFYAMREIAEEFGGLGGLQHLREHGSDGRFYGFSLYFEGHPNCSDFALSFVVDGATGQVVGCYEYRMERQTPLIFVPSEDSVMLDDFALPNAMWPVDADACGVRLDGERPADFFRLMTDAGLSADYARDGAGP